MQVGKAGQIGGEVPHEDVGGCEQEHVPHWPTAATLQSDAFKRHDIERDGSEWQDSKGQDSDRTQGRPPKVKHGAHRVRTGWSVDGCCCMGCVLVAIRACMLFRTSLIEAKAKKRHRAVLTQSHGKRRTGEEEQVVSGELVVEQSVFQPY